MDNLDTYMRARDDRCSLCGWHPETQGHNPDVPHDVNALRPLVERRVPPDPMSDPAPDTLLGVVGPTRTVRVPPEAPERFDVVAASEGRPAWTPVRPVEDVPLPDPPQEDERPW